MVEGRAVTVVDLDGTLVQGNTLHLYLRAALRCLWWRRPLVALWVAALMASRAVRLIPHSTMKYGVARAVGAHPAVIARLKRMVQFNPDVERLINERRKQGDEVVLATAAFGFYAKELWEGELIASELSGDPETECRGERKAAAVSAYLDKRHATLACVITDHYDDLPLLRLHASGPNYLILPSQSTIAAIGDIKAQIIGKGIGGFFTRMWVKK